MKSIRYIAEITLDPSLKADTRALKEPKAGVDLVGNPSNSDVQDVYPCIMLYERLIKSLVSQ